jgi:hypothetical protein
MSEIVWKNEFWFPEDVARAVMEDVSTPYVILDPTRARAHLKRTLRKLAKRRTMGMVSTQVKLADGTEVDSTSVVCENCGDSLDGHSCAGGGAVATTVTSFRTTRGPRKDPRTHPQCSHCKGSIHTNMASSAINAECLNRQYSVAVGDVADAYQRMPTMTLERMGQIFEWGQAAAASGTPITYGTMENGAGGAATYSGLRPKTGRKGRKPKAGENIEELADEAEVEASTTPIEVPEDYEGNPEDYAAEQAQQNGVTVAADEAQEAPMVDAKAERKARRAARSEERRKRLASIS